MPRMGLGMGMGLSGKVAAAGPALSVTLAPSSLPWSGSLGGWFTTDFTATVQNSSGALTWLWEFVSDPTGVTYWQNTDTGADTNALGNDGDPNPGTVTLRVTVTDSVGSAVSNTVTVS